MKKKIFFLADSSVDLRFAYDSLKKKYDITWVYYHKKLKFDLVDLGCKEKNLIFLLHNSLDIVLKKILTKLGLYKINFEKEIIKEINIIDKKFKPNLWITDTGSILSKIKLGCPKVTFKHAVSYKKYFNSKQIFEYDYTFIPGDYHFNRILSFYPDRIDELSRKLIISPSAKILPYFNLKNNTASRNKFFKSLNLNKNNKTVLLAPTYNSFFKGRFLPKKFDKEDVALEKICKLVTQEFNFNFIIKLHHYHYNKLKSKEFNFLNNFSNVHVFESNKGYDRLESEKVFINSDIVITDTSGVGPICCFLNKKMIYLNPDDHFDWSGADIEKKLRPGFIMKNINSLKNILLAYKDNSYLYKKERSSFNKKIYKYKSLDDLNIIHNHIKNILDKNDQK